MLPRLLVVLALLLPLAACGGPRWAWKEADLDRNRFDLAVHRGADTASRLGEWATQGTVVEASGSTRGDESDLEVVMRYERVQTGWLGQPAGVEVACYLFTTDDGHGVEFDHVSCPD